MKLIIVLIAITLSFSVQAQIQNPVHFSYSVHKVKAMSYEVYITASMDKGWHIYAQAQPPEAIAEPTKIIFDKNPLISFAGKPKEKGEKEKYEDKQAGIVQYQYGSKLDFVQTLTLKSKVKTSITGTITYQACTGEMCLPPKTIPFTIAL